MDHSIVAKTHTDHSPVVATAAALGRTKSKAPQAKINTEILLDPGTREEVQEVMDEVIRRHKGWKRNKATQVWEDFKKSAFTVLQRITRQKRNEVKRSAHYYRLTDWKGFSSLTAHGRTMV